MRGGIRRRIRGVIIGAMLDWVCGGVLPRVWDEGGRGEAGATF